MDPILTKKGKTIRWRDPILADHSTGVTKALHFDFELYNRGHAYIFHDDYPGEQIVA
jgi:hypothetical protein